MPFNHAAVEQATEQRALDAADLWRAREAEAEQYAADVKERGVGPFYGWKQPGTAYEPR
jgi:hypothetical protein